MARTYVTTTTTIDCSNGAQTPIGPGTVAVILRPNQTGTNVSIIQVGASYELIFRGVATIRWSKVGGGTSDSAATLAANKWYLVAAAKLGSAGVVNFSIYDYALGTWVHQAGLAAADGAALSGVTKLGAGSQNSWAGEIALLATWSAVLTDAQVECLPFSLAAWYQVQPKAMWILDQAAVAQLVPDLSGGGAGQSAITGTQVSTFSVPIWTPGQAAMAA